MNILDNPTSNIFFTGKGGVGKTSISCAVAVALADRGKSVLLVSTDPASNLDEVFVARLGSKPQPIDGVSGLAAMNVDPEAAAAEYRERVVGPYRGVLPDVAIASMEEQLAGACTVEIAAFDEFAKLIGSPQLTADFEHVVFDTAPTGHTLRLLTLPTAWTGFIETNTAGTSCLGPLQGMVEQRELYAGAVKAIADAKSTTLALVSRPDHGALDEAARTSRELSELGVNNQTLIVNGVFEASDKSDAIALAMEHRGREALDAMPAPLQPLSRNTITLKSGQLIGVDALRGLLSEVDLPALKPKTSQRELPPGLETLIDDIAAKDHGLVMTMGKGGVGKTTVAAHIAVELARRGLAVHLTTTDPAAHVKLAVGDVPANLQIGEINPEVEVERYRAEVLATTGANLDANGRALLEEDLSSPCTEEIAVFQAFARTVQSATDHVVVLDTAPTGHTILLLDAAQSYHREVSRQARAVPEAVLQLLSRLRDRGFTRVILCTLAEATPVHEAAALQEDLRRADIEPCAWVINQSLAPLDIRDSVLVARKGQEQRYIDEVVREHAGRAVIVPWLDDVATESGALLGRQSTAA
ncbi:MAG: arsenical pump-driving ATPase [Gammaproteobacteria bacterium]